MPPATETLVAHELYVRGGNLARIGLSSDLASTARRLITCDERQAVVLTVSAEYRRRRPTERAQFQVYRRRENERPRGQHYGRGRLAARKASRVSAEELTLTTYLGGAATQQ
jgi:hypothetical protein